MSDIVLGYWGIRGRGQILRHLLSYTGLSFEQRIYKAPEEYAKDTAQLGNFPNLPYLRDGDFVLTETLGIARYIARRAGRPDLLGNNPVDEAVMDNFIYAFDDLFAPLIAMFFNKKVNDIKVGHFYKIQSTLERFDKFINGKDFVLGYITIADFILAEYSHYIQKLYPLEFTKYKNIKTVRDNIQGLPEVKGYYERKDAILTPFLPPSKTSLPFFWPGTQPVIPSQKPFAKKVVEKQQQPKKPAENTSHEQPKQPQIQLQQPVHKQEAVQQNWDQPVDPQYRENPHKVVIISGSLSGGSMINYLLGVITGIGHPAFQFSWCDISNLELHNQDIQQYGTENVNNLRGQVYEAEAVLIGVSQTHSIVSSVLTNAYNWLVPVLKEKPVALVSIQSSQTQFRRALDAQNIPYLKSAKLSVSDPSTFFSEQGSISGPNFNRVVNFFNKFAIYMETGN